MKIVRQEGDGEAGKVMIRDNLINGPRMVAAMVRGRLLRLGEIIKPPPGAEQDQEKSSQDREQSFLEEGSIAGEEVSDYVPEQAEGD